MSEPKCLAATGAPGGANGDLDRADIVRSLGGTAAHIRRGSRPPPMLRLLRSRSALSVALVRSSGIALLDEVTLAMCGAPRPSRLCRMDRR